MKIYIVLVNDRHTEPDVEAYVSRGDAMRRCREIAEAAADGGKEDVYEVTKEQCGTYAACWIEYSAESDSVAVLERELHFKPPKTEEGE